MFSGDLQRNYCDFRFIYLRKIHWGYPTGERHMSIPLTVCFTRIDYVPTVLMHSLVTGYVLGKPPLLGSITPMSIKWFKVFVTLVTGYTLGAYTTWLFRRAARESRGRIDDSLWGTRDDHSFDSRLAVVIPIHDGDKAQAIAAISGWPSTCYATTLAAVDLVIYKAEARRNEEDLLSGVPTEASACFRKVRIIYGDLTPEVSLKFFHSRELRMALSRESVSICRVAMELCLFAVSLAHRARCCWRTPRSSRVRVT